MHTVITSLKEREKCAVECIESFNAHWGESGAKLIVYYEGDDPDPGWRSTSEVDFHDDFMEAINAFAFMSGLWKGQYNIQHDARQCRKVFFEAHAVKIFGGKVFWMDSDVITHADVPSYFLDSILPDDRLCCYLGRDGWFHTESGFIGFNADHKFCKAFFKMYLEFVLSGANFSQPGWHDCFAFDYCRKAIVGSNPALKRYFNDLAEDLPRGVMHPFISSVLGAFMDHRKGPRKDTRSSPSELVVPRREAYWK
jgi:hypothetical protein